MTSAIVADNLTRHFGDLAAVDGLDLEIEAGEVFGVLDHNGAGKTTTVRLLNGVLQPSGGSMRVLGLDPASQGPELRRRTGVLTESPSLDDRLTARMNLRIYADIYGVPKATVDQRVTELLERFDLLERADEKVGAYSKGMRQRLALARTLVHSPELIFLDEPTAGLDPSVSRDVHALIRHLSQSERRTVFLCTHNLVEAQRLCDRVAVLAQGKLLAQGTPAELGARLGRRQRVRIRVGAAQTAAAVEALQEMGEGIGVEPLDEEGGIRVFGVGHDGIPALVARLVACDLHIYRVAEEEVSLEDVYFALQDDAAAALERTV